MREVIAAVGAHKLKDTGRVIAALKERYHGQMDFACARLLCQSSAEPPAGRRRLPAIDAA